MNMIYIWKDDYPAFVDLANIISRDINLPHEITNDFSKNGLWIVFFSTFVKHRHAFANKKYIAVQTENINASLFFAGNNGKSVYLEFLRNAHDVWDYSRNFKLGYSKYYEIQYEQSKEIDVLFYGSINDRRSKILEKIPNAVVLYSDTSVKSHFFPDLWNYVRKSKVVMCINYYENAITDTVRLTPLLVNRAFFISEKTMDSVHNDRKEYVVADYNDLVPLCEYFLNRPEERLKYIESGHQYIKNNPFAVPDIFSEKNANLNKFYGNN